MHSEILTQFPYIHGDEATIPFPRLLMNLPRSWSISQVPGIGHSFCTSLYVCFYANLKHRGDGFALLSKVPDRGENFSHGLISHYLRQKTYKWIPFAWIKYILFFKFFAAKSFKKNYENWCLK